MNDEQRAKSRGQGASDNVPPFDLKEAFQSVAQKDAGEGVAQEELSLRPQRLKEYIGQKQVVDSLSIAILAAKKGRSRSTTLFFKVLRVWERPPLPTLSRRRWRLEFIMLPARRWRRVGT